MKIKKILKYYLLGKSLKEIELDRILNKVSNKIYLSNREVDFINLYNSTVVVDDDRDYMMLSKSQTSSKIKELIELGKTIICNLHDRDGKLGLKVVDVLDDIEEDYSTLFMKNGITHKLEDKFLYNLIYNLKKSEYSLEEQDEYFEKIESKND